MELVETLRDHERAWNERPLLRRIYRDWFALMASRLSDVPGPTVELGAGLARFREVVPDVVETDVEETPWADLVVDAESLPYADGELANIVMLDVFHHLPEAGGVPGGGDARARAGRTRRDGRAVRLARVGGRVPVAP